MDGMILAQDNERYEGYTVFTLNFNGVKVRVMAFKDVNQIVSNIKKNMFLDMVSELKSIRKGYKDAQYKGISDNILNEVEVKIFESLGLEKTK